MPSLQAPATVLVSGATGYIGAHVVRDLVDRGFNVRAAVRRTESGEYLKKISPGREDQVTYTLVKDIADENAFDEAVKGVDAIMHLATPVDVFLHPTATPKDVIGPAIAGTIGILKSAYKYAPSVKRVIIVSSTVSAGFLLPTPEDQIIDETTWNEFAISTVEADMENTSLSGAIVYTASKTLAEKAAFQFVKDNTDANFDVVSILPPYVFGPFIHDVPTKDKLNASQHVFSNFILPEKPEDERTRMAGPFTDVRDIAAILSLALQSDKVAGERFFASAARFSPQDLYDALASSQTSPPFTKAPKGVPGSTINTPIKDYSNKKVLALFGPDGFKFRGLEECAKDTARALDARGWWD